MQKKRGRQATSYIRRTPKGWQNDNFIHFISLLCHPFGVVDFISSSSRGCASLHHLPVVVPALRASLHNRLLYKIYPCQAGVTLRSTTCLWSFQPFGLHFTTGCYTRYILVIL
ncbi:MAG: hypothetical protein IKH88_07710 [Prevotella sp.]|nr:hypothetical protein [Prevotella sp.]